MVQGLWCSRLMIPVCLLLFWSWIVGFLVLVCFWWCCLSLVIQVYFKLLSFLKLFPLYLVLSFLSVPPCRSPSLHVSLSLCPSLSLCLSVSLTHVCVLSHSPVPMFLSVFYPHLPNLSCVHMFTYPRSSVNFTCLYHFLFYFDNPCLLCIVFNLLSLPC